MTTNGLETSRGKLCFTTVNLVWVSRSPSQGWLWQLPGAVEQVYPLARLTENKAKQWHITTQFAQQDISSNSDESGRQVVLCCCCVCSQFNHANFVRRWPLTVKSKVLAHLLYRTHKLSHSWGLYTAKQTLSTLLQLFYCIFFSSWLILNHFLFCFALAFHASFFIVRSSLDLSSGCANKKTHNIHFKIIDRKSHMAFVWS